MCKYLKLTCFGKYLKLPCFGKILNLFLKVRCNQLFLLLYPKSFFLHLDKYSFWSCFFFNNYLRCGRSSLKKRFFVFCGTQAKWEEGSFNNVDHRSSIRLEQATLSITNDRSHPERRSSIKADGDLRSLCYTSGLNTY